jgi:hypothetical protein
MSADACTNIDACLIIICYIQVCNGPKLLDVTKVFYVQQYKHRKRLPKYVNGMKSAARKLSKDNVKL